MASNPDNPDSLGPEDPTARMRKLRPGDELAETLAPGPDPDAATSDTQHAALPRSGPGRATIDDATSDTAYAAQPRVAAAPPPAREPEPGEDFADFVPVDPRYYARGEEIARGGMGRIVSARDRRLGRPVAIKELLVDNDALRLRFEREALITARLQHPAIVSLLEAGTWPSGEPFYVMRYVRGETLDALIRARKTLEERMALLPNLIAVVDALAYAHDAGVIHRDLKPANVLVGSFGETVVIDWGLAKDLRSTTTDPGVPSLPPILPVTLGEQDATVVGSVMGTPAFMPPEQARGEAVDSRADVYSLGAMLYQLLSGVAPYSGTPPSEVLGRVLSGPPAPTETLVDGVRADLLTIVGKAMSREPAARYPSAVELAADLRRFQTGQLVGSHEYSVRERLNLWLRKYRTAVRVGAVALLALAAVSGVALRRILRERARVAEMRQLADRHRGEAEELLGFMLEEMRDKLEPMGKLDLLDSVAKRALAYYNGRDGELSPADERKKAQGLSNLGKVLYRRGDLPGALGVYQSALEIRQRLAAAPDADSASRLELCESQRYLAEVRQAQGDFAAASAAYTRSAELGRDLLNDPIVAQRAHDRLAGTLSGFGYMLLERGERERAEGVLAEEMRVAEAGARRWPNDVELAERLGIAHEDHGAVLEVKDDRPGALAAYRAFLAIEERLAAAQPDSVFRQRGLSMAYYKVAEVHRSDGALDQALRAYASSNELAERLANNDPSNADAARDLMVGIERVGTVLERKGDTRGALAQYTRIVRMIEGLLKRAPGNTMYQHDLADALEHVAQVRAAKDPDGALADTRRALAILTNLHTGDPSSAGLRADLAVGEVALGKLLLRHDREGALAAVQPAVDELSKLAALDPQNAQLQRELDKARGVLAEVKRAQGRR